MSDVTACIVRGCQKPRLKNFRRCGTHRWLRYGRTKRYRKAHRNAALEYQRRHAELGLCQKCAEPKAGTAVYCEAHLEWYRKYQERRRMAS